MVASLENPSIFMVPNGKSIYIHGWFIRENPVKKMGDDQGYPPMTQDPPTWGSALVSPPRLWSFPLAAPRPVPPPGRWPSRCDDRSGCDTWCRWNFRMNMAKTMVIFGGLIDLLIAGLKIKIGISGGYVGSLVCQTSH